MGVVNRGVAVGDFHAPPAFERREQHEQIRDSITLVLVVVARLAPRLSGNSRARLKDQLFRGFVETHDGALRITRPLVDFQHVFHVGNEGRVGLRRDHPLLLEMRLENVFLRVRPIVLSLAHRTMLSSTTFCSRRRRLHLACPAGAGPHVSAISFASAAASNIRGRAECGLYLRVSTDSNPSSTNWCLVRSILAMLVSRASAIRLSLQPSPAADMSAFSRIRAFVNNCAGRLPAWIKSSSCARSSALNRTTYFLTATSFVATNHLRRWIATTVIQNTPSNAMTRATSGLGGRRGHFAAAGGHANPGNDHRLRAEDPGDLHFAADRAAVHGPEAARGDAADRRPHRQRLSPLCASMFHSCRCWPPHSC